MKERAYEWAKAAYAAVGVDTDWAIEEALKVPISVHCWQSDDLTGFISNVDKLSDGGIMATGDHPGKARNGAELRADLDTAFRFIPGKKKVNLHAIYAETEGEIGLEDIQIGHFSKWIEWANEKGYGVDFNPTCFSHPMVKDGYTIASKDEKTRKFWVEHIKNTRKISAEIAKATGQVCVHNIWVPDGEKDSTVDRLGHRAILKKSLDEILFEEYDRSLVIDTVESKLFGIGSESFVAGSHEFYLLYAQQRGVVPCLDMGHFHPTESVADKISAMLLFFDKLQIHTSRGVRWDSDHVVVQNDALAELMAEIKRADAFGKVMIALDYFDGSINRVMATAVGARSTRKAILSAMLEPTKELKKAEEKGGLGRRLAMMEEMKNYPFEAVWRELCRRSGVCADVAWIDEAEEYEREILKKRK